MPVEHATASQVRRRIVDDAVLAHLGEAEYHVASLRGRAGEGGLGAGARGDGEPRGVVAEIVAGERELGREQQVRTRRRGRLGDAAGVLFGRSQARCELMNGKAHQAPAGAAADVSSPARRSTSRASSGPISWLAATPRSTVLKRISTVRLGAGPRAP